MLPDVELGGWHASRGATACLAASCNESLGAERRLID